jgi:hypothetical protein
MSFKTFFEHIERVFKVVFTTTTWEKTALSTMNYVEPLVIGILSLTDPAIVPLVSEIMALVTRDINTVKTVVQQGTVAPGTPAAATVVAALQSVKDNLNGLLDEAEIKNSIKREQITSIVTLVNQEVDAVLVNAPLAGQSA